MRPSFLYRFSRHRGGVVGALVVLFFIGVGFFGPLLVPHDPLSAQMSIRLQPPSAEHWMGTDELGRDFLSRLVHGAGISIRVGLSVVFMGALLGVPLGAVSAYAGGLSDLLIQRVVDTIQAFPGVLLLILIAALLGPSLELAILGLGLLSAPSYARLIRSTVLVVRNLMYVEAARAIGCGDLRILVRHVLPNASAPVIVQSSLQAASALILLAGISFLGLGAQPPTPEWGAMLAEGRQNMRSFPHLVLFPGVAVSVMVLGLNLVGDALRDALDPKAVYGTKR